MDKWQKIRSEYINNGSATYPGLAKKYGVSESAIAKRGAKGKWKSKRKKQVETVERKVLEKTAEIAAKREVSRISRLLTLSDKLIGRIEEAEKTIDKKAVVVKDKDTIVIEKSRQKGKPGEKSTRHVVKEHARTEIVPGLDTRVLKDLTWSLKTILDTTVIGQAEQGELPVAEINEQIHSLRDLIKNPQPRRELPQRDSSPPEPEKPEQAVNGDG